MRSIVPVLKSLLSNRPVDWPRYFLKALVWQVRKNRGHIFITVLPNGACIKVYPSTAYSGIFYQPWPEGSDLWFIRKHAALSETFVDVGANVGLFSASLFDRFRNFVCFEPAPSSFRALRETVALNPKVNCELHNVGVGNTKEYLYFENEDDYSTTSRFVAKESANTISILVDTLDHLLDYRYSSLVMKIDVEGFEEKVFAGAERLFSRKIVKLVMF